MACIRRTLLRHYMSSQLYSLFLSSLRESRNVALPDYQDATSVRFSAGSSGCLGGRTLVARRTMPAIKLGV